jgi:hypothetical protein
MTALSLLSPLVLPHIAFDDLPLPELYSGGIVVCPDFNGKVELIISFEDEWIPFGTSTLQTMLVTLLSANGTHSQIIAQKNKLSENGHTFLDVTSLTLQQANDAEVIFISEELNSSVVNSMVGTTTGVVNSESLAWNSMKLASGTSNSVSGAWTIEDDAHPIFVDAGLQGSFTPIGGVPRRANGVVGTVLARASNGDVLSFAYETGQLRTDGTPAPARVVGMGVQGDETYTADGLKFWLSCLRWAAGLI